MRLFVAIRPPGEIRELVAKAAEEWLGKTRSVRRVPAHSLHLTLAFLGEVDERALPELDRALERCVEDIGPIPLCLADWGRFPPRGRPRVYWLGVDAGDSLPLLAERTRHGLLRFQPDLERKRFSPHMTVARMRGRSNQGPPNQVPEPPTGSWTAGEVTLVQSQLGSGPARYSTVERYPLPGHTEEPADEDASEAGRDA